MFFICFVKPIVFIMEYDRIVLSSSDCLYMRTIVPLVRVLYVFSMYRWPRTGCMRYAVCNPFFRKNVITSRPEHLRVDVNYIRIVCTRPADKVCARLSEVPRIRLNFVMISRDSGEFIPFIRLVYLLYHAYRHRNGVM